MKKIILVALGLLLLGTPRVKAGSGQDLDNLQAKVMNQTAMGQIVYGSSQSSSINLQYIGTATGAYVAFTNGLSATFYAPFNTVDTSIGSSGVVTFGATFSSNTVGGLCNYVNSLSPQNWRCTLTGAFSVDSTTAAIPTATNTFGLNDAKALGGYNVPFSTNVVIRLGINPSAGKRVVLYQAQSNGAGTANLFVYGQLRKYGSGYDKFGAVANDSYLVWKQATSANTTLTTPVSTVLIPWLEFDTDEHVVLSQGQVGDSPTANTQGPITNFLQVLWSEK